MRLRDSRSASALQWTQGGPAVSSPGLTVLRRAEVHLPSLTSTAYGVDTERLLDVSMDCWLLVRHRAKYSRSGSDHMAVGEPEGYKEIQ